MVDGRRWGVQDGDDWRAYTQWFIDQDLVIDADDKPIESIDGIPGGDLYSNDLLPDG